MKMPFSKARYGTRAKFSKMKRCVKKVGTKGKVNPHAVCRASIYPKNETRDMEIWNDSHSAEEGWKRVR
jgi:hypothetical protein